jgi:PAS domain S-box-containing protein
MGNTIHNDFVHNNLFSYHETLARFFEISPYILIISRAKDGKLIEVNTTFCAISGYSREEALTGSTVSLDLWANPQDRQNIIETLKKEGAIIGREVIYKKKNGQFFTGAISAKIITLNNEDYIFSSVEDITIRKNAEEKSRKLSQAVEQSPATVVITNTEGLIEYVNPKFTELTGYTFDEAIGQNPRILKSGAQSQDVYIKLWETISAGNEWHGEFHNKKKNGDFFWEAASISPIKNENGEITHYLAVKEDITERKHVKQLLEENIERYQIVSERMSDFTFSCFRDSGGYALDWMAGAVKKVTGYSIEEVIARKCWRYLVHQEDLDIFNNNILYLKPGEESTCELRILNSDNEIKWLAVDTLCISGPPGRYEKIYGGCVDITERKETENALNTSYEIIEKLTSQVPGVVYQYRLYPDGRSCFPYSSPGMIDIYGVTSEEVKEDATPVFGRLHPEDYDYIVSSIMESSKNLSLYHSEFRVVLPGQGVRWRLCDAKPERMEDGSTLWYGIITDITERKRTETIQQIQYNIARSILTIDRIEELLEVFRVELGKVLDSTNFFVALYNPETDTLHKLIFKDEKDDFTEWPADKSMSGQVVKLQKSLFLNRDEIESFCNKNSIELIGSIAACWVGVPITLKNSVAGALVLQSYTNTEAFNNADVALLEMLAHEIEIFLERQNILTDLIIAKNKAEENDKLKTAFIQNISHEIRTPLNVILGLGDLWAQTDLEEESRRKYFNIVQDASQRLMNTVSDYMDMAMIVSGAMKPNIIDFDFGPYIQKHIQKFSSQCAEKQITFIADFPEDTKNIQLSTDPELINKVLKELTDNAIKFTEKGSITLGGRIENESLYLFVKDTGKGISKERIQMIFDMFSQEDVEMTRGYEGSGLGLSISRGIIDLLGGKIWAESEKGFGASFYFSLPYKPFSPIGISTINNLDIARSKQPPLILFAEDDESNFLYFEAVVHKTGCNYLHARDGVEAVELCHQNPGITFVLMDIKMPVLNGLEATKLIREFRPDLPIIALTAYAQTGDEQRILEAGCNEYFPKPIKPGILSTLIKKYADF